MAKSSLNSANNPKPTTSVVETTMGTTTVPPTVPTTSAFAGMQVYQSADDGFTSIEAGNYVIFLHSMTKKYPEIVAAHPGIREGSPVLMHGAGKIIKLEPFRAIMLGLIERYIEIY